MFVEKGNVSTIGVKAFNLYRCRLLDVDVPDFIIIPTDYYKKYKSGKLEIDKKFLQKLKDIFEKINDKLAVRSSCVIEDLNKKSNAGRFKTVLDVDSYHKLKKAVFRVWSSANGNDMAVIIQKQITPEIAGVLFTRNPVNSNNETIIEFVEGFGTHLVSGKKDPEKIVINNNLKNRPVTYTHPKYKSMEELIRMARFLETAFGCPLDIEWARSNGKYYILQARPITNLPIPDMNQGETYSRVTAEQFYSGPVSPLFYSIFNHMYSNFYIKATLETLGIEIESEKILVRHKNHLYIDTAFARAIFSNFPIRNNEFLRVFPEDIRGELIKQNNRKNPMFILKILKLLLLNPKYLPSNLDRYFIKQIAPAIIQNLEEIPDFKYLNQIQLNSKLTRLFKIANIHIQTSKWGLGLYLVPFLNRLERLLKRNGMGPEIFQILISGLEINKTMDASSELRKLSQIIKKNGHAYNIIKLDHQNYYNFKYELEKVKNGEFIIDYFEFILKKYGHRRLSRDILAPSWNDEPMIPFAILRRLVLEANSDPPDKQKKMQDNRLKIIREVNNHLSFIDRILLRILLKYLNRYIAFRELQRFYLDKIISKMREFVLEISHRMKLKGFLKEQNDVFFLELSDITGFLSGKINYNLDHKITFNKITFSFEKTTPGKYMRLGVDFDSISKKDGKKDNPNISTINKLKGQAVSPGIFSGRARVIENIDKNVEIQKNEILITRCIDPGQTHVFLLVSALVLEVGGILSHGAILAREFNLPTVAQIKNATQIIKNGQKITVNGTSGEIIIDDPRND